MKTTVSLHDFHAAFEALRPDNFTPEALDVLFNYFEALEDDTGDEIELDVIGICCEYAEETPDELAQQYGHDTGGLTGIELSDLIANWLHDQGVYIGVTEAGTIVYCQF